MLIEIVTSGSVLTKHLFVVRLASGDAEDGKIVFKLGRDPSCQVTIKQNTISRVQCCLIWQPKKNKWSIVDSDTTPKPIPVQNLQLHIQPSYGQNSAEEEFKEGQNRAHAKY